MKASLLAVGKLRPGPFRELAESYLKRLRPHGGLRVIEVPHGAASLSCEERRTVEGKALLARIGDEDWPVALDGGGRSRSSEDFARLLGDWRRDGRHPVFLVGGADGLSDEVLGRARERLSFSAMTFPHELFRVMLLEQIYRGHCILAGHPYHK